MGTECSTNGLYGYGMFHGRFVWVRNVPRTVCMGTECSTMTSTHALLLHSVNICVIFIYNITKSEQRT
jgi:hypothetical protein